MPCVFYNTYIPAKISGRSLWDSSTMVGFAERRKPRLISYEITVKVIVSCDSEI